MCLSVILIQMHTHVYTLCMEQVWDEPLCNRDSDGGEAIALRWESKELKRLGGVLVNSIKSSVLSEFTTGVGTALIGASFAALDAPRQLWNLSSWIDNCWQVPEIRVRHLKLLIPALYALLWREIIFFITVPSLMTWLCYGNKIKT